MSLSGLQGFRRWNPINIQKKRPSRDSLSNQEMLNPPMQAHRQINWLKTNGKTENASASLHLSWQKSCVQSPGKGAVKPQQWQLHHKPRADHVPGGQICRSSPEQHWRHTQMTPSSLWTQSQPASAIPHSPLSESLHTCSKQHIKHLEV